MMQTPCHDWPVSIWAKSKTEVISDRFLSVYIQEKTTAKYVSVASVDTREPRVRSFPLTLNCSLQAMLSPPPLSFIAGTEKKIIRLCLIHFCCSTLWIFLEVIKYQKHNWDKHLANYLFTGGKNTFLKQPKLLVDSCCICQIVWHLGKM